MLENKITELQSGFHTAFIDGGYNSNLAYRPQFIYNNNKNGQKVFSAIEDELLRCDSYAISVAFITRGGITSLLGNDIELIAADEEGKKQFRAQNLHRRKRAVR